MQASMKTAVSQRLVSVRRSVAVKGYTTKGQSSTNESYLKSLPGITEPFPNVFDPAGLSSTVGVKDLKRWRESELVHGRVAMLAAVGFLIGENVEDSKAFFNFDGRITGPAIYQFQQVRQGFWEPLLIAIGLAESYRVLKGWATPVGGQSLNALKEDYAPGDLGFDPLGLRPKDPAAWKDIQDKELNNGRLAMIAVAGFTAQELVNHQEIFEHLFLRLNPTASIPPPGVPAAVSWVPGADMQFTETSHSAGDLYQVAFADVVDKVKSATNGLPKPSLPDGTPDLPNLSDLPKPPQVPPAGDVFDKASKAFQGLGKPSLPDASDLPKPPQLPPTGDVFDKASKAFQGLGKPSLPNASDLPKPPQLPPTGDVFDKASRAFQGLGKPSLPNTSDLPNLPKPPSIPPAGDVLDKAAKTFQGLSKPSLPNAPDLPNLRNLPNLPKPPSIPPAGDVLDKAAKTFQDFPKPPSIIAPKLPAVAPGPNGPAFKDAIPYSGYLPNTPK